MNELITSNIWKRLTAAVKKSKTKSYVAVAYFGKGGASMLPLSKGSKLVVDASEMAVKSGQTYPKDLLKLYSKGVRIYSLQGLHAKLFVIGTKLFIGSTNVSNNSSNYLTEVLYTTSEKESIRKAKSFIENLTDNELGFEKLTTLSKIKVKKTIRRNGLRKKTNQKLLSQPVLHVFKLDIADWTEEEERQGAIARRETKAKNKIHTRHHLEEFLWETKYTAKVGDFALQVVDEGKKTFVSPPGEILNIHKWGNRHKQHATFNIEVPDARRKNISIVKSNLKKQERNFLNLNGRRNKEFGKNINSMWK